MTPRFDSFSIITADLAASLAFYRRLGLDIPDGAESAPHVEVHLAGGQRLLWDTEQVIAALDPEWKRPAGGERLALAFACDSAREVDTLYAELVAAGHTGHMEPWDATWGQRYAVVLDPDGCGVSLFAPLS
ncbi:VOC family protein [Streptomyces californicus]|uniref:VOC family protein n=1 Tax=Streptomyces californicus TaxID=67351 RepID=UPI00364FB84B